MKGKCLDNILFISNLQGLIAPEGLISVGDLWKGHLQKTCGKTVNSIHLEDLLRDTAFSIPRSVSYPAKRTWNPELKQLKP